jgi:hypothetical protein
MARTPRPERRTALAVLAVVLCAGGLTAGALALREPDAVATVDGHPVTADEIAFHMRVLEPAVQNELQVARGATGAPLDWDVVVDGESGRDVLRERALDQAVADKQLLLLAQEAGLVADVDFAALTDAREAENAGRAAAVARGEVVYGLTRFGQAEYYTHTLTELRTRLRETLSAEPGDPLHVTDAEVAAAYAAAPEEWAANVTTYRLTRLTVPAGADRDAIRTTLAREVAAEPDLAAVATAHPGASVATETLDGAASALTPPQQQTLQLVTGLATGQATPPVDEGTGLVVLRVDEVAVDTGRALAEYGSRIRESVVAEKLDGYLARRTDDSAIVVDRTALATIDTEGTDT